MLCCKLITTSKTPTRPKGSTLMTAQDVEVLLPRDLGLRTSKLIVSCPFPVQHLRRCHQNRFIRVYKFGNRQTNGQRRCAYSLPVCPGGGIKGTQQISVKLQNLSIFVGSRGLEMGNLDRRSGALSVFCSVDLSTSTARTQQEFVSNDRHRNRLHNNQSTFQN